MGFHVSVNWGLWAGAGTVHVSGGVEDVVGDGVEIFWELFPLPECPSVPKLRTLECPGADWLIFPSYTHGYTNLI